MKKLLAAILVIAMVFALATGTFVSAASVAIESLDRIYVNGGALFNGGADAWLAANEIKGKIETIGIFGWIILADNEMPASFGYKIDDGDPVPVEDSVVYDQGILDATENAFPNMRRDVFTADVSEVGLGEHTFTIAAWNEAGDVAYGKSFTFTQELDIGEEPPPAPPAIVGNSLDAWNYWYADGSLGGTPAVHRHGECVGFHIAGWFGYNYDAVAIGYRLNGVETFVDGAFRTPETAVITAGGEHATRYDMDGSFADLLIGANSLDIIVKLDDPDQSVVNLFSGIPAQIIPADDEAVWFYNPNANYLNSGLPYSTGCWIGPNCGYPDGSDIAITFETPDSFDGVFEFAFASPAPDAAVINVNLYDEDDALLETVTQTFNGDSYAATFFSKVYPAGTYTLQYEFAGGLHFVLGSGELTENEAVVSGVCNNQYPDAGLAIALIKAEITHEPSVSTGNASLDNFQYDGAEIATGSKYIWINDPANRPTIDFVKGSVSEIYFRGWAQLNNPITGFGYMIDGTLYTNEFFVEERSAELAGAGFSGAQGYAIPVPVVNLDPGEHTINIVAIDDIGEPVQIIKTKSGTDYPIALTFTVTEEAIPATLANMSFNTIRVDGELLCDVGNALTYCPITGDISTLGLRGWAFIANSTIDSMGYKIDGGDPVCSAAYIQERSDVWAAVGGDATTANGFDIEDIDVSGLEAGEHTVTIVVKAADGSYVEVVDVPVVIERAPAVEHTIAGKSFDWYAKNGAFISTGGHVDQFVDDGTGIVYLHCGADVVGFMGWAALADEDIDHFAYAIDGGDPITDENNMFYDRAAELEAAGIAHGFGYWIIFDYSALEVGEHSVTFYAVAADGTPVEFFSYNFDVQYMEDFTWLYDRATYTTGFWTGPNCGMPTGNVCIDFDAVEPFDAIYTAFFADNVPGALMRVDLYDEDGELLESVEQKFVHNDDGMVKFSKAYAAGTYTVDYVYIGETGHFVLGSGTPLDIDYVVSGVCNIEHADYAPSIALRNAELPPELPAPELIKATLDIFDLSNGILTVQGWAGANYPANNLGYRIDDGEDILDGIEFANFNTPEEGEIIKGLAGENAFRFKTRGSGIALDLTPGEHTITLVMRVNDGEQNHIVDMKSKTFTVSGTADPAAFVGMSFNTIWLDEVQICDVGNALEYCPLEGEFSLVGLRGWARIKNSPITLFGYRIDDGEPVFDAAYTQDRSDVWAAFGVTAAEANGFNIQGIDVSELEGEHTITVVVQAEDGTVIDIVEVPLEKPITPAVCTNAAWDDLWYDEVKLCEAKAYSWVVDHAADLDYEEGTVAQIYFRGWAQLDKALAGFGYVIDDGEVVSDPSFIQDRAAELEGAGFAGAQGYAIWVPVDGLAAGQHTIKIVAIAEDGSVVEIFKSKGGVDYPVALTFTITEAAGSEESSEVPTEPDDSTEPDTEPDDSTEPDTEPDDSTEPDTEPDDSTGEEPGIPYDVNDDGFVDNKDVVALFRYVSSDAPYDAKYDIDGDNEITNKDVVALFRIVSSM